MPSCTFFGHRNSPSEIRNSLTETVVDLIEGQNVTDFFIGHNGNFDRIALSILKGLEKAYPQIRIWVILEKYPVNLDDEYKDYSTFPEALENALPQFAIQKRNYWMVDNSDFVVCFVNRSFGGAFTAKSYAEKRKKTVINLATV